MKINNDQSGIAHVAIVFLVVVVIGVIGLVGWKVWDMSSNKANTSIPPGPEDMQSVYVNVSGFTDEQNKCVEDDGSVLGFTSIYRHKEKNPTIKYTTTFQLNPKYQVKIGDWYYSTDGLPEDSNCIEGLIPADYTKLVTIFNENFKKLEKY